VGRAKVLIAFAVLGYLLGVGAYYLFRYLEPYLRQIPSTILWEGWFISGVLGAILAVLLVIAWAYLSSER